MMEHFEKNPEKLKEQSQSKENPTRHFYPGGSSSRSQEDVQQNLSSASKDADVPSVSAQPSRIGLKDRLSDPIRRLYTNLHAYFWQESSVHPNDAEKHHFHEISEYEKLVGELHGVQSEMEFLNKRYNKAIVSNELSEMHNLSIFFSKMDDMLENTVKRVDKGIEGCSSNIEYMEKYIADIGKQIEQMERDNLALESKPFSHWVENSKRFLESENNREILRGYQKEVDDIDEIEVQLNMGIEERNVFAKLLREPEKVRQSYEGDIPVGEDIKFYRNILRCVEWDITVKDIIRTRKYKNYNLSIYEGLIVDKLSCLAHGKYGDLIKETVKEASIFEEMANKVKLTKDRDYLTAYLRAKKQKISEIKCYSMFEFRENLDEIEKKFDDIKLAKEKNNYDDIIKTHNTMIEELKKMDKNFKKFRESNLKSREENAKSLQNKILLQEKNYQQIQEWLKLNDDYYTNYVKCLMIKNRLLNSKLLLNLKEKKDYNERKLEHYKIVHNKICNLCNEVNKIREDLIDKINLAQMLDDPKQKPIAVLRRTSSENALARRGQAEKLLQDFRSKAEKQKDYWNFLKDLERREDTLIMQINLHLDKISKKQAFECFRQKVNDLLEQSKGKLKQREQEHIESEKLEKQATQAVKQLLYRAIKETHNGLAETDALLSTAVDYQIAGQVDNLFKQQEIDQHVQKQANQLEKWGLTQAIESKLNQFWEDLQRSLEIVSLPLDYARLKNDSLQYCKKMEEDLKSIRNRMEQIEKDLQTNEEELEKTLKEENEIYGGFMLDPARIPMIQKWEEDRTKKIEDLANEIKGKYREEGQRISNKENITIIENSEDNANNEKLTKTIGDLLKNYIKDHYEQEKVKLYNEAYKVAYTAFEHAEKAAGKEQEARNRANESKEREQAWHNAREEKAKADEKLMEAERKIRDLDIYEDLANELQQKGEQIQAIVEILEKKGKEQEEIFKEEIGNRKLYGTTAEKKGEARRLLKSAEYYKGSLKEGYSQAVVKINSRYSDYDEILKKIGQAEMYVTKIKDLTDQKQRLSDDREAIQKRLQQVEESLAEIKKYQDIEKELEQVKKKKEIISVMINKEHINFDKLKSQEKEIDKFNSILTESVEVGMRPYQELHLMEKNFLEMEKALKKKENEVLLMQSKLESVENEILQIKNNLEKENMQQREFKVRLQLEKEKSKILHKNREAIEKDNISRFDGKNDKKTERLALLQKNIKEGNEHIKCDNPTIEKAIAERNTLAETLNQKRQTIEDYRKTFLLSAEYQDRTYFEMGRIFEDHIAVIKDYISEDGVSISCYDKLIKDGLIYESAKNVLYKEYMKGKYDKEKERILKELKEEINNQKAKENESQLKFNEINEGIASEEKRLSTKQQERQILQENLATIRLEMEECAAKVNDQKKSKKELSDEIKDRALPETEVVRIKNSVADLARERTVQLYGLILPDTEVARVSTTPARAKEQEIAIPEILRENQEAQGVLREQAGSSNAKVRRRSRRRR